MASASARSPFAADRPRGAAGSTRGKCIIRMPGWRGEPAVWRSLREPIHRVHVGTGSGAGVQPDAGAAASHGALHAGSVRSLSGADGRRVPQGPERLRRRAPRLQEKDVLKTPLRWSTNDSQPVLQGTGPIVLSKYTMHEAYSASVAPTLRTTLRFQPALRERAQSLLRAQGQQVAAAAGAHPEEVVYIGIHVRRTDLPKFLTKKLNMRRFANESYYVRAVDYLRTKLFEERAAAVTPAPLAASLETPTPTLPLAVVVVSDDMNWVNKYLVPVLQTYAKKDEASVTQIFAAGTGKETDTLKDLSLISACNHTVLSYGSYGITAALLSGGYTVVFHVDNPTFQSLIFASLLPKWTILD